MDFSIEWPVEDAEVVKKISQVPHYSKDVTIHYQVVNTVELKPMCLYIRTYRLDKIRQLVSAFNQKSIPLFDSVWITHYNNPKRLLPPPIIELQEDRYVIIDGLHRVFVARNLKQPCIGVMVVQGNLDKLPAAVVEWSDVRITSKRIPRAEKFRNLDESKFRQINKYLDHFN